jgi:hypothetical protein
MSFLILQMVVGTTWYMRRINPPGRNLVSRRLTALWLQHRTETDRPFANFEYFQIGCARSQLQPKSIARLTAKRDLKGWLGMGKSGNVATTNESP